MATIRQRGDSWAATIKRAGLLPRPVYLTFDTRDAAEDYCRRVEAFLDRGVVPPGLLPEQRESLGTLRQLVAAYVRAQDVPQSDQALLDVLVDAVGGGQPIADVNYAWAESWIRSLKTAGRSPSTIRHHVGALARALDWCVRRHPDLCPTNPLRILPRGYASYSATDAAAARAAGAAPREDEIRDRRLLPGEEDRIRAVLAGERPEGRQRPLDLRYQGALELMFTLMIETAMRLREVYTLDVAQVDVSQRTIHLHRTKNGDSRQVPLSSPALAALDIYRIQVDSGERRMGPWGWAGGRLLPWWDGVPETLPRTTWLLSRQFARVFSAAGCQDLRAHDLRHEATCRLFERTTMDAALIARITGHRDPRMLRRYASLRGSDLARYLW
jgi:integrase